MEQLLTLGLKQLEHQIKPKQLKLVVTNIFFSLLKNPKTQLKMITLKLPFHRTNIFTSGNPVSFFF